MRGAWKHFFTMSDDARAILLAKIAAVFVIVLLYSLGAASLYLRQRYLLDATPVPATRVVPTRLPNAMPATTTPRSQATPTLYPTITPSPNG